VSAPSAPGLAGSVIVFDLDGTLVDTAPDLTASLNHVLASERRPPIPAQTVRMIVGHGARALIERGFTETGEPVLPETLNGLVDRFVRYYAAHIADDSAVFPGVREALGRLKDAGAALAVCTNKPEGLARALLDAVDLTAYFAAVTGGDTLAVKKPDPAIYRETIRRAGKADGMSVMVGDSPTDVATARAAGVAVIAVTFGYTPVPPSALGADRLIGHFDELDAALALALRNW
jgi:phosphoglycolate phosphatase